MARLKVWTVVLVLLSFHGNSNSQTDLTIMTTEIMGTALPTYRTLPPSPPPSSPPPPPSSSQSPPPSTATPEPPVTTRTPPPPPPPTSPPPPPPSTDTPEPPVTTRTPPPPPPPTPPPPPPSSSVSPSPTPDLPTTATSTPLTRSLTTTVAMETTRQRTEPISVEPNPIAESLGKIGVLIETTLDEFDRAQFKEVIAREVNNYCSEYLGQCVGEGKTVSAIDVVIVNVEPYEIVDVNDARRRLLQEEQILVEYYVQDPILDTNVMLTTEQQRAFLDNEDVQIALERDIDGYTGIAPAYAEPVEDGGLEGWEIALIVIGSVAAVGLGIGAVYYFVYNNDSKSDELDLELQEKKTILEHTDKDLSAVETNGLDTPKKKLPVDEADVSTQVKYKDILTETGYEAVEGRSQKDLKQNQDRPNGTSVVVTAEITSSSSGSATSSERGDTELDAIAQDKQDIPPNYEPPPSISSPDPSADEKDAVDELDKLINYQTQELTVNSAAFQNPGFDESPYDASAAPGEK